MAVATFRRAPVWPMLRLQTWAEFLKLWRVPAFTLTSLFLPVMFYAFIGVGQASQKIFPNVTFGAYFLASMAVYSVANVMIFSFGISVATERGMKMDVLQRATPMPPLIYLLSKCITALFFAALTLVVLFPFAYVAGHVRLDPSAWVNLASRVLLGSIPFIALGFAIGYLSGPNSAVAVVNLIYLPTAFASGLFFPKQLLPQFIQQIAPYLPLHFFGQLGWDAVGAPTDGNVTTDWLYLVGYGVLFFVVALWAYRREENRKFT
ncbi:MAG TPA: ABC transporter permease [Candidatus Angelobacter sp.]|jgi:ABC-2 type transport system permease protein|nr:ABC transporter permease [Candidatus Angelobacter sp.]